MKKALLILFLLLHTACSFAQGIWREDIYAIERYWGDKLTRFNWATCSFSIIGNLEGEYSDITFTPNGKLYGIRHNAILELDTATAEATLVCAIPGFFSPSLTYLNDSVLLGNRYDTLWSININSCSITPLGTTGYNPWVDNWGNFDTLYVNRPGREGDLTWLGNRDLYLSSTSLLFKIKLNSAGTAIVSCDTVYPNFLAFTSPGLINITRDAEGNLYEHEKLLGFSLISFVKIMDPVELTGEFCYPEDFKFIAGAAKYLHYVDTSAIDTTTSLPRRKAGPVYIDVYPNPSADGTFILETNTITANPSVGAFDLLGKRVAISARKLSDNRLMIEFPSGYANGVYILEFKAGSQTVRRKVTLSN